MLLARFRKKADLQVRATLASKGGDAIEEIGRF